jgi:hypothetical protein
MKRSTIRRTFLLGLLSLAVAGAAEARQETLRWTHPLGSAVASFHIYVGSSPGAADLLSQNVGVPTPDGSGIYTVTIDVDTEEAVFVRMTALDVGSLESAPSNEITRTVPLGVPGRPTVAQQ